MNIKYGSVASTDDKPEKYSEQSKETTERLPCSLYLLYVIILIVLFSGSLGKLVLNQYAYVAFRKMEFPNITMSNTDKDKSRCDRDTNSTAYKIDDQIQADVSAWSVYTALSVGIPTIISATLISAMSDRYGRKYCLLLPLFGGFLKYTIASAGVALGLNTYLFNIFFFVDGTTGSWIALVAVTCSYIADVTTDKNRSFAIAVLGFFIEAGITLATFISGYLIRWFGFAVPVAVSSVFGIISIILTWCCLSESLQDRNRVEGVHPFRQLRAALDFYITKEAPESKGKRWRFILYITAFILTSLGTIGKANIEIFYLIGLPFCLNSVQISYFGTVRTVVQQCVGLIMIRVFQCCISDISIAIIGTISAAGYFAMEGLATNTFQLYMGTYTIICTLIPDRISIHF